MLHVLLAAQNAILSRADRDLFPNMFVFSKIEYCRFPKIAPRVRKLFLNMSFTLGEEPPLTLGEELQTARYRRYRSQILQENVRWKALAEIYTMHSFAPVSHLKIFVQICNFSAKFARCLLILREFLTLGSIFWNL